MKDVILVGFGGALGALSRFFVRVIIQKQNLSLLWSTLLVNFVGSFFFSFLMYSTKYIRLPHRETQSFLIIGFLGAFTTFSSLEYEVWLLLERKEITLSLFNLLGNISMGFGAILLGKILAMGVWK
ncbi:MAG: fluoride efflux transporter FluC [Candidatus Caldatribacteriaceae bacterium]